MNPKKIKYFHLKGTSIIIEPDGNGKWGIVERTTEQMLKDKMFEQLDNEKHTISNGMVVKNAAPK